jgi:hypothetical protein
MMKVSPNPYTWNKVSTSLFYGRHDLATELLEGLVGGSSFGIVGGRRMGKSVLLAKVMEDIRSRSKEWMRGGLVVVPVHIDGLELPYEITPGGIFHLIARRLSTRMRTHDISAQEVRENAWVDTEYLDSFFEYLTQLASCIECRLQVVIFFDEIEPVLKHEWGQNVFFNWRKVLSNSPVSAFISAVFAGATEMRMIAEDIGSPLAGILKWKELELFSLEDTSNLVNEPTEHVLSPDFTNQIFELTGGQPCLIQYLMHHVCNADLIQAEKSLAQARELLLHEQTKMFDSWWQKLEPPAPHIYQFLVDSGIPTNRKEIVERLGDVANQALSTLCHVGIARYYPDTQQFQSAGTLFRDWTRKYQKALTSWPIHCCSIAKLVSLGESETLECKSSLQWDIDKQERNKGLRFAVLKTVVAFLNTKGGTLVIGVGDDGSALGLAQDLKFVDNSRDRFEQLLMSTISDCIGAHFTKFIQIRFEDIQDQTVCAVDVDRSPEPAYVTRNNSSEFYVRVGCTTRLLDAEKTVQYVRMSWK